MITFFLQQDLPAHGKQSDASVIKITWSTKLDQYAQFKQQAAGRYKRGKHLGKDPKAKILN